MGQKSSRRYKYGPTLKYNIIFMFHNFRQCNSKKHGLVDVHRRCVSIGKRKKFHLVDERGNEDFINEN